MINPYRYLTHVSVTKHIYRPGDTVHIDAVVLGVFDLQPMYEILSPLPNPPFSLLPLPLFHTHLLIFKHRVCEETRGVISQVTVAGPSGASVHRQVVPWTPSSCFSSVVHSSWSIPSHTPGGVYVVEVAHSNTSW